MNYVPITGTSPASGYWGIDQDITYGSSKESILNLTAGIVDTGSTLILLATGSLLSLMLHPVLTRPADAFQQYQQVTGATRDEFVIPYSARGFGGSLPNHGSFF